MHFEVRAFSPTRGLLVVHWDGTSETDIRSRAASEGWEVISLQQSSKQPLSLGKQRFPIKQFSQDVLALIDAGFSLVEALETLQATGKNENDREITGGLLARLRAGESFSQALGAFPEQFPPLFSESVHASEQTGNLADTLRRFIEYEDRLDTVKSHVVAASLYPALLILSGLLVMAFMLLYVVPRLAGAYDNVRGQAPAISRLLFAWGDLINAHPWSVVGFFATVLLTATHYFLNGSIKRAIARHIKRLPILGEQIKTYHLARFYRTVGMLLKGGTPVVRALDMAKGILPDDLRMNLERARAKIIEGHPLSIAFQDAALTTTVAYRMFKVGERSGDLGSTLEKIATFHDERLAQWVKRFIKIFEPALMVVIGALIGGIVLLMYMPIFELAGGVG